MGDNEAIHTLPITFYCVHMGLHVYKATRLQKRVISKLPLPPTNHHPPHTTLWFSDLLLITEKELLIYNLPAVSTSSRLHLLVAHSVHNYK